MGKSKKRRRERERQRADAERSLSSGALEPQKSLARPKNSENDDSLRSSQPHNRSSNKLKQEGAFRESLVNNKGTNGDQDIESRKRSRRELEFVYPKKDGVSSPYSFKKRAANQNGTIKSTVNGIRPQTGELEEGEQQHASSNQSLDDILSSSKNKKKKRTASIDKPASYPEESVTEGKLSGMSVEDAVRDKSGLRPRANSTDGELNLPRRGLCDEHMVLQAHKWSFNGKLFRSSPRGLVNLGNTCFLNSTLQCLSYLPPFCQSILAMPDRDNNGKKSNQGKRFTMMLKALFHKVHGSGEHGHGAISPSAVVRAVPTLGTCGSRNGHKFRPGRQEDAHEFLVHLLDAMHDGELRESGIDQRKSGWRDRLPVPRLDETTFLHRIFGGYLRSQVRCTKCGYCSNTYDPFLDLALEVSRKSTNTLAAAFNEFTRKETLDSENRYKCDGCKKRVCATKQLTVFRPPLSLCVQLKRFTFGGGGFSFGFGGFGGFGGKGRGNKVTKPIGFPAEMNLPLSDKRSCGYGLTGMVIHVGGSSSSGHYTAYVKKAGSSGSAQWYHMDDSFVEAVSEKTVLRQKDAYLLFYCRKEVKLEFPSPPISMTAKEAAELGRQRARSRSESFSKLNKEEPASVHAASMAAEGKVPAVAVEVKAVPTEDLDKKVAIAVKNDGANKKIIAVEAAATAKPANSGSSSSDDSDSDSSSDEEDALEGKGSQQKRTPISQSSALSTNSGKSVSSEVHVTKMTTLKRQFTDSSPGGDSSSSGSQSSSGSSSDSDDDPVEDTSPRKLKPVDVAEPSSEKPAAEAGPKAKKKKKPARTRVVLDRGSGREKVSVMMGPRFKKKKTWNPQTSGTTQRGEQYELLGNRVIDKWADDGDAIPSAQASKISEARTNIVNKMEKKNRAQKRKAHLSSWDMSLDRGKTKKVKIKSDDAPVATGNGFQRILTSLQSIKRPKGFVGKGSSIPISQKKRKHNR